MHVCASICHVSVRVCMYVYVRVRVCKYHVSVRVCMRRVCIWGGYDL